MGKKNVQGGNKTKAMARKTPYENSGSRTPQSEEEKYGIIKSVSGSGRFRVVTSDKKTYVGILPGSMRGHKKRNNYVGLDTIVLINDRSSWQTVKDNSHADIIHVYTASEQDRLELPGLFQEKNSGDNKIFQFQDDANIQQSIDTKIITFTEEEDDKKEEVVDFDFI